jgi:hypothetical protein
MWLRSRKEAALGCDVSYRLHTVHPFAGYKARAMRSPARAEGGRSLLQGKGTVAYCWRRFECKETSSRLETSGDCVVKQCPVWRWLSSGLCHRLHWCECTSVSKVCAASIIRAMSLHSATNQKTAIFVLTAMRTANPCVWFVGERWFTGTVRKVRHCVRNQNQLFLCCYLGTWSQCQTVTYVRNLTLWQSVSVQTVLIDGK